MNERDFTVGQIIDQVDNLELDVLIGIVKASRIDRCSELSLGELSDYASELGIDLEEYEEPEIENDDGLIEAVEEYEEYDEID